MLVIRRSRWELQKGVLAYRNLRKLRQLNPQRSAAPWLNSTGPCLWRSLSSKPTTALAEDESLEAKASTEKVDTEEATRRKYIGGYAATPPIAGPAKVNPEQYLKPHAKEIEAVASGSDKHPGLKDLQEEHTIYLKAKDNPKGLAPHQPQDLLPSDKEISSALSRARRATFRGIVTLGKGSWEFIKNPRLAVTWTKSIWQHTVEMFKDYLLGTKLLWKDIKTAKSILKSMLRGNGLTRRERKQLLRTSTDIIRMIPLAIFLVVPFLELLLPFALKLYPNLLPSTFQSTLKAEEDMKRQLRMRLAMAGFLQEMVTEMVAAKASREQSNTAVATESSEEESVAMSELQTFVEKVKMGRVGNQDITRFARAFKDELTLENSNRGQLANLCMYMGLPPFGSDAFLRFQLRSHLRSVTHDDQRILWEGLHTLDKKELQEACRERGMRAIGLTKEGYRRQMRQWLDLSITKQIPISLLIMSRAFTLDAPDPDRALAQSISAMDDDVVTEVLIEAASGKEKGTPEFRAMKLQSLERQNELIDVERRSLEAKKEKDMSIQAAVAADAAAETAAVQASAEVTSASSPSQQVEDEPVLTEAQIVSSQTMSSEADDIDVSDEVKSDDTVEVKPALPTHVVGAQAETLSVEDLRALESLATPSPVEKEKAQLAQMKAAVGSMQEPPRASAGTADDEGVSGPGEEPGSVSSLEFDAMQQTDSSQAPPSDASITQGAEVRTLV